MIRKFLVAVAGLCLVSVCFGRGSSDTGQRPGSSRIQAILDSIRDRASHQNDVWFSDGEYPRTIQSLRVLHSLFPHDYELTTDLGWMLENVENYTDALAVYIGYRSSYPKDPEAYYPEAEFYFREKLYSKVPPLIEPSLKLSTHPHANSYRILARSYEKLNLFGDSKRIWDTYLNINPNDGQAKVNRERVMKKLRSTALYSKRHGQKIA